MAPDLSFMGFLLWVICESLESLSLLSVSSVYFISVAVTQRDLHVCCTSHRLSQPIVFKIKHE